MDKEIKVGDIVHGPNQFPRFTEPYYVVSEVGLFAGQHPYLKLYGFDDYFKLHLFTKASNDEINECTPLYIAQIRMKQAEVKNT